MTDLDDAYENGKYISGAAGFPPRWAKKAARFRAAMTAKGKYEPDVAYGDHPRARLDVFLPDAAPKGLVVFVHGGYWKAFDKSSWSHLAAGALAREYAVVMPEYVLAPEAGISDITRQIAAAIDLAAGRIAGPIHLTGHSAGGHLVTRMLCDDMVWTCCFVERVARVVSISGLHDLRPLLKTRMNEVLRMDKAEAVAESPLLHKNIVPVPVTAFVGGDERPAFMGQSRALVRAWENAHLTIAPNRHHFNVIDGLEMPDSPLMRVLLG